MADTATLQQYLAEAEQALHLLLTGQSEAVISTEGKSVTYRSASIADLRSYIAGLKQQLGLGCGRRPLRPTFNG